MSRTSLPTAGLIALWALVVGSGFLALGAYHAKPGAPGSPPERWPVGSSIPLDRSVPTLLIFIHPRCPCSPASLAELEEVRARCRGRVAAHVVTFRPEGPAEGWGRAGGTAEVDREGPSDRADPGGREGRRFGVETSGHVLLFDPSGIRRFSGGITISRGHRGANAGLDRLIATILGGLGGPGSAPVFGCPVLAPSSDPSGRVVL